MSTAPRAPVRGIQLALLAIAAASGLYARSALGLLQESIRHAMSLSDNQMALLQGPALSIPIILAAIPLGLAIDRFSRARLLFVISLGNLAGSLLSAFAADFTLLLAARCLVGLTAPATWIAAMSLLADWYPPAQRGRANMTVVIGQCAGNSAAFAFGGWLLTAHASSADAWREALLWMAVPSALAFALMCALREPERTERQVKRPALKETYRELWRYRATVAPLLIGLSLLGVADAAAVTWVAPTLARRFALPADEVGVLLGGALLMSGVLGPLVGGMLADACQRLGGPRKVVSASSVLAVLTVPLGLFALAPSAVVTNGLFILFMMLGSALTVAGTTLFTVIVPNELRGLCMALLSAAYQLCGFGLAPLLVSGLSGTLGGHESIGTALAWVCAVSSALSVWAFLRLRSHASACAVAAAPATA